MKYNKDKWVEVVKKTVADLKSTTPTAGKPCAIATMRYVRDGILDDIFGGKPPEAGTPDADTFDAIKESFSEIIKGLAKDGATEGFASNASAAAKAAGFKSTASTEVALED